MCNCMYVCTYVNYTSDKNEVTKTLDKNYYKTNYIYFTSIFLNTRTEKFK